MDINNIERILCDISKENFDGNFNADTDISNNTELLAIFVVKIDEYFPDNYVYMEQILDCKTIKEVAKLVGDSIL